MSPPPTRGQRDARRRRADAGQRRGDHGVRAARGLGDFASGGHRNGLAVLCLPNPKVGAVDGHATVGVARAVVRPHAQPLLPDHQVGAVDVVVVVEVGVLGRYGEIRVNRDAADVEDMFGHGSGRIVRWAISHRESIELRRNRLRGRRLSRMGIEVCPARARPFVDVVDKVEHAARGHRDLEGIGIRRPVRKRQARRHPWKVASIRRVEAACKAIVKDQILALVGRVRLRPGK